MSKAKNKFYQLTPRQERDEKLSSIYKMINEQQKTMDEILTKYKGDYKDQGKSRQSKTLDARSVTNTQMNHSVEKQRSKAHSTIIDLPVINSNHTKQHVKRKKQKLPDFKPIPYFSQLKNKKDIQKLKEKLSKAYLNDEDQKSQRYKGQRSLQKIERKDDSRISISKMSPLLGRQQGTHVQVERTENQTIEKDIPQPLGYIKSVQVEEDDQLSSNQGDVPLTYYQREFRGTIRNQCLQETNFLYFSKNESMKDWTQNLLLLFQKHDKELALLRKRCKYLQKFDNSFFSIDIFRND